MQLRIGTPLLAMVPHADTLRLHFGTDARVYTVTEDHLTQIVTPLDAYLLIHAIHCLLFVLPRK